MSEPGNIPENFAASLLAAMPDAVIYADIEGRIRFWNAGASLDIITPEGLRARHWQAGWRLAADCPIVTVATGKPPWKTLS